MQTKQSQRHRAVTLGWLLSTGAIMEQIGTRIKHLRKRANMTQSELAKLSGIAQATVSEIESGYIKESSASIIFNIADALKTSARWITFGGYKVVE